MDVDIAIVGAGPAGLYVAWRLMQEEKYKRQKICLFDAADRFGGRVASVKIPDIPFVADVGAMRYLPDQILVNSLSQHLGLCSEYSKDDDFNFETTFYSLRGDLLHKSSFDPRSRGRKQQKYKVEEGERDKDPFELIVCAIQKALSNIEFNEDVPTTDARWARDLTPDRIRNKARQLDSPDQKLALDTFEPEEWRFIKRYGRIGGRPLYATGFWDLLQSNLSIEGYHLAHDGSGYQSIFSMWNAAEAIVWFLADFSSGHYKTILGGMEKLIECLYKQFIQWSQANGRSEPDVCKLKHTLVSIHAEGRQDQRRFRLIFMQGGQQLQEVTVTVKQVILALPQPALKNLRINVYGDESLDTIARQNFHNYLESVTPNPLFKLFLVYDRPWWTALRGQRCKDESFKVNTDQPLRQIYHFGPDRQHSKEDLTNRQANYRLVMASYSDARYAEYWNQLHKVEEAINRQDDQYKAYCLPSFRMSLGKEQQEKLEEILRKYGTPERVVHRAQYQLWQVYGRQVSMPPAPLIALYQHWSDPPYYTGWHSWNMGSRPWVVARRLVRPFPEFEIYTCGEAFSSEQGWIEGALKSAERVLEILLDGSEPPWLMEEKDLHDDDARWSLEEYHRQKILWF